MNPTMTLAAIRAAGPCEDGWRKLLAGLGYADGKYDPERVVSLGDVATTNNAADALWCVRALDWNDIAVRRAVIAGAVMPAVRRAAKHTTDPRVASAIDAIDRWRAGDDSVDLEKAARAAWAAWAAARAEAEAAATWAAAAAAEAWAAEAAAAEAAWAAEAAAWAAEAAAWAAEREQQRQDIIASFPPVAHAKEHA